MNVTSISNVLTNDDLLGLGDDLFLHNEIIIYCKPQYFDRCRSFNFYPKNFGDTHGMTKIYKSHLTESKTRKYDRCYYDIFKFHLCRAIHGVTCGTSFRFYDKDFYFSYRNGRECGGVLHNADTGNGEGDKKWSYLAFDELLDFVEIGNTICYSVAKKLYNDFKINKSKFMDYLDLKEDNDYFEHDIRGDKFKQILPEERQWLLETYDQLLDSFCLAKNKGAVIFS